MDQVDGLEGRLELGADALVVAVAHGNYKDSGCALAAAAPMSEVHAELSEPMPALADVGPALRRALLASDASIDRLSRAAIGDRQTGRALPPGVLEIATFEATVAEATSALASFRR
ncbi:MAG: hypothetical protein ACREOE_06355 [Gemmatimonadales bacterium]